MNKRYRVMPWYDEGEDRDPEPGVPERFDAASKEYARELWRRRNPGAAVESLEVTCLGDSPQQPPEMPWWAKGSNYSPNE